MSMSRKHFVAMAASLAAIRRDILESDSLEDVKAARINILLRCAQAFAAVSQESCEAFNRRRFMGACGFPAES